MVVQSLPILAAAAIDVDITMPVMMVVFILLWLLLKPLLITPYLQAVDARREGVEGAREEAADFRTRAESAITDYEEKLRRARREAAEVRDSLRHQGQEEQKDILGEARKEINEKLAAERVKIAEQTEAARAELEARATDLAQAMVERVLPRAA